MAEPGKQVIMAQEFQPESFQDVIREMLKTAPWLAVSIIIHLVIGFILANVSWGFLHGGRKQGHPGRV